MSGSKDRERLYRHAAGVGSGGTLLDPRPPQWCAATTCPSADECWAKARCANRVCSHCDRRIATNIVPRSRNGLLYHRKCWTAHVEAGNG